MPPEGDGDPPIPSPEEEAEATPRIAEARRDFDAALEKINTRQRRKNKDLSFDVEAEEFCKQLKLRMLRAAEADISSQQQKRPALEKLNMLDHVTSVMLRKDLQELLLDHGILEALRVWLEPLEDGTLVSYDLKNSILDSLSKMDIEPDHLMESGIGKVLKFMTVCARENSLIQQKANDLINRWSSRMLPSRGDLADDLSLRQSSKRISIPTSKYEQMVAAEKVHASIPKPALFDYRNKPKPRVNVSAVRSYNREHADDRYDSLIGKMKASGKKTKGTASQAAQLLKPSVKGSELC